MTTIIPELQDDIRTLQQFLMSRSIANSTQTKIVFNNSLKNLNLKLRQVFLNNSIDPHQKIEVAKIVLPKLQDCFNYLPAQLSEQWMDLTITCNFVLLYLTSLGRQFEDTRLYAAANILVRLLMGIRDVEFELEFSSDQEISKIRNALTMTSGVFLEAILTLYELNENDLIQWANRAHFHFAKHWTFVKSDRVQQYIFSGSAEEQFQKLRFCLLPLWNSLVLALNLVRIYGDLFPENIDTHGLYEKSFRGVADYAKKIHETFQHYVDKVNDHWRKGIYDKNDNPFNSEHIQRVYLIGKFALLYVHHINTYSELSESLKFAKMVPKTATEISKLMEMALQLKDEVDQVCTGQNVFDTNYMAFYYDLYELMLEYSIHCEVDDFIQHDIIDAKEKIPLLYYKLFTIEQLTGKKRHGFDIEFLEEKLKFRQREFLDVQILTTKIATYKLPSDFSSSEDYRKTLEAVIYYYQGKGEFPEELGKFNPIDYHTWFFGIQLPNSMQYFPIGSYQFKSFTD